MTARSSTQHAALTAREARRLALHRSGLLGRSEWPRRTSGHVATAHAIQAVTELGYLQLDTIPISGARSHGLVLASRLPGYATAHAEDLLGESDALFEYWGHEVSWLPISLYGAMAFRRAQFRERPWWKTIVDGNQKWVDTVLERITEEGPLGSRDFASAAADGSWYGRPPRRVLAALWSSGELAVHNRIGFERSFDLTERVIPAHAPKPLDEVEGVALLLETAAALHGWAAHTTLTETFRLRRTRPSVIEAFALLRETGRLVDCDVVSIGGGTTRGVIRPVDLACVSSLHGARGPRGVLLSPFDPLVWDRKRAALLFDFDAIMEFFKPAHERRYGYYCLPVLAGDNLVSRVDLRANRKVGTFEVLSRHDVEGHEKRATTAVPIALARHADAVGLSLAN
ncbi:MAG: hypothetical protein ACI81R_002207 [Bradymonadia bacterium]|jgi:uncharacterized protein YcaQ